MNSGIYEIKNIINNKKYYGSTNDFTKRKSSHFCELRKRKHKNPHLQAAFNKYGESNFIFTHIVYCAEEHLLGLEQIFIDINKNGYNINTKAGKPPSRKGILLTDDHKEKMKQSRLAYLHENPIWNLGKKSITRNQRKDKTIYVGIF